MDLLEASWFRFMGTKHLWNVDPWDFSAQLDMLGDGCNDPERSTGDKLQDLRRVGKITQNSVILLFSRDSMLAFGNYL